MTSSDAGRRREVPESGAVSGRWVLSVAGPDGFAEIEARPFSTDAAELPDRVAGLANWARERMAARFVPPGLYTATCELDRADEDPVIIAAQAFPWADLGPWPLDPWVHPDLPTPGEAA